MLTTDYRGFNINFDEDSELWYTHLDSGFENQIENNSFKALKKEIDKILKTEKLNESVYVLDFNSLHTATIVSISSQENCFWVRDHENRRRKFKKVIPKNITSDLAFEKIAKLIEDKRNLAIEIYKTKTDLQEVSAEEFRYILRQKKGDKRVKQ